MHTHTVPHTHPKGLPGGNREWWTDTSNRHPASVIISWSGVCSQWALLCRGQSCVALSARLQVVFTTTMIGLLSPKAPRMFFSSSAFQLCPRGLTSSHWQLTIPFETNKIIWLHSVLAFLFHLPWSFWSLRYLRRHCSVVRIQIKTCSTRICNCKIEVYYNKQAVPRCVQTCLFSSSGVYILN